MADFLTSTHRDHWMFCRDDLLEKTREANDRAVQALQEHGATRVEIQSDGLLTYPGGEKTAKLPPTLTLEEEFLIRRYYEQKLQQVCGAFAFPNKIQATAVLFFKRFYLSWSVMEHDPKQIMLTCIYLSCKVEEFHVSAEELGKGIHQDHQFILKNELVVLQALKFDLIVYSPYRPLEGFIMDLQKTEKNTQKIMELQNAAFFAIHTIILTDCPLFFPPGQIALAALRMANHQEKAVDMDRYLRSLCDRQPQKRSVSELISTLNEIAVMVDAAKAPIEEDVKRIDRKLKFCRNPGLREEGRKHRKPSKHKSKRPTQETPTTSSPMVTAPPL